MATVPNFVGMTEKAAYQLLIGNDAANPLLTLGKVTYEQSDTVAKGLIISQSLDPEGDQVPRGTKVGFVVSSGPAAVDSGANGSADGSADGSVRLGQA